MTKPDSKRSSFPLFSLILSFVLWTFVGMIAGFIYLVAKTPEPISSNESLVPVEEDASLLFAVHKNVRYYRNQTFRHKAEALAKQLFASASDEIEVSSGDLNSWAKEQFGAQIAQQNGSSESKPYIAFIPETPQFQIASDQLHIAYPFTVEVLNQRIEMLALTSGEFVTKNYSPQWKMDRLYLNSAPIPFKQAFYNFFQPHVMKAIAKTDEVEKISSAWNVIKEIEIKGTTMIVRRK